MMVAFTVITAVPTAGNCIERNEDVSTIKLYLSQNFQFLCAYQNYNKKRVYVTISGNIN